MTSPLKLAFLRQLPRDKADTLLLLASALLVLLPHAGHLPPWIAAVTGAALGWRAILTLRGKRLPRSRVLLPVAVAAMGGVYASFHTLLGRDAGVAMLALLLAFKLLEMHARRDLFVVVFLSFFLLLTNFFYSQSIATAAAMLATVVLLLTAQLSFQYTGAVPPLHCRLRLAAAMVGLAAPLALLLFVAFPRIQGPIWGLPGDAHGGRTGITDSMAPGTLSELAQSDEIAFRVKFDGAVPPQNQLYWRGIVLGNYDGRRWTRGYASQPGLPRQPGADADAAPLAPALSYQVTLEPTGERWLFALDLPLRVAGLGANPVRATPELEFTARRAIGERVRYEAASALAYRLEADAAPARLQPWLALPAGFNPRTLAWAQTLQRPGDPQAGIRAVLQAFRTDRFRYTLAPPLLGRDAVDDFLFGSKAGFCEHYAGAFVVLMRAMGIPARVVTGYQGGELNPFDGYLAVRQSDAHAWAEVWLARRGWVRIDPTAAVAPERVERNLARALPAPAPFGLQGLRDWMSLDTDEHPLLSQLRLRWGAVNNDWNQWVLDYNPERQRGLLQDLAAGLFGWPSLAGACAIGALLYLAQRLRLRRRRDALEELYLAFCRQQARRGAARATDEGPQRYGARLAQLELAPGKKAAMARFLAIYGAIKYGVSDADQKTAALKQLQALLNESR